MRKWAISQRRHVCNVDPLSLFFDSDSGRCEVPDRLARIGDSQWSSSESWKILWFPAKGVEGIP